MDPKIEQLLRSVPELLAWVVRLVELLQARGASVPPASGAGPDVYKLGQSAPLVTVPIGEDQIEALSKGMAEAAVIEKAVEYVKGFVAGAMIAGA